MASKRDLWFNRAASVLSFIRTNDGDAPGVFVAFVRDLIDDQHKSGQEPSSGSTTSGKTASHSLVEVVVRSVLQELQRRTPAIDPNLNWALSHQSFFVEIAEQTLENAGYPLKDRGVNPDESKCGGIVWPDQSGNGHHFKPGRIRRFGVWYTREDSELTETPASVAQARVYLAAGATEPLEEAAKRTAAWVTQQWVFLNQLVSLVKKYRPELAFDDFSKVILGLLEEGLKAQARLARVQHLVKTDIAAVVSSIEAGLAAMLVDEPASAAP